MSMRYKKNYREVIARLRNFYSGGGRDRIYVKMDIPNPAIERMKSETADGPVPCPDLNARAEFWDEYLSAYADLEDDSIPCAYISEADQGLAGGMLGGEVRFLLDTGTGWVSSMVPPFAESARDIYNYKIDLDNKWYRYYNDELDIFRRKADGKFGVSHWCCLDGLHLLGEMRGFTEMYFAMMGEPETCRYIIDFASKLSFTLQNRFFEAVGLFEGGTCSNMAQWLPGRCISESVDMYHLARPELFEKWGRAHIQSMIDRFDGAVMHIHSNGHHLIEHIRSLSNLRCILLLDDVWAVPVYQEMERLDPLRGSVPYCITIPFEAFAEGLARRALHPNVLYTVSGVPDIKTANSFMKEVVTYRA